MTELTNGKGQCCEQKACFGEIWEQYEGNIRAMLRSKVANEADAEDLFQEILLRTYTKLHTIKSDKNIKAWVFQITRNAIIDYYRKQGRATEELSIPYGGDSSALQKTLARCIEPFINELPDDLRDLVTAIDLEGTPQKEYAERHGLNYSTLKSRVQRGRTQLRNLFEDCCRFSRDAQGNIIDFHEKSSTSKK